MVVATGLTFTGIAGRERDVSSRENATIASPVLLNAAYVRCWIAGVGMCTKPDSYKGTLKLQTWILYRVICTQTVLKRRICAPDIRPCTTHGQIGLTNWEKSSLGPDAGEFTLLLVRRTVCRSTVKTELI